MSENEYRSVCRQCEAKGFTNRDHVWLGGVLDYCAEHAGNWVAARLLEGLTLRDHAAVNAFIGGIQDRISDEQAVDAMTDALRRWRDALQPVPANQSPLC